MAANEGATKSIYPGYQYAPKREATRKGAHERTVGHQWRHLSCGRIIHEEPLIGFDREETHAEASARHERLYNAVQAHDAAHAAEPEPESSSASVPSRHTRDDDCGECGGNLCEERDDA